MHILGRGVRPLRKHPPITEGRGRTRENERIREEEFNAGRELHEPPFMREGEQPDIADKWRPVDSDDIWLEAFREP